MIKKILISAIVISLFAVSGKSQLYSFGIKDGGNYSIYHLSNNYVFYQPEGTCLAYHAAAYLRRNIGKFFIQADAEFIAGLKAMIKYRGREYEFSKSSFGIPIILGRMFYPGTLRFYGGAVPSIYFGESNIENFLRDNRLTAPGSYGSSPGLGYLAGTGIDFGKLTIDISYRGNIAGGFFLEKRNPSIQTWHRFNHIFFSLGFKIR